MTSRPAKRPNLTPMRAEILKNLANGETQKATASRLGITPATVAYHLGEMQRRFRAPSSTALVALAIVSGVLTAGQWPVDLTGILTIDVD